MLGGPRRAALGNLRALRLAARRSTLSADKSVFGARAAGTQITCFTSTKVQILTQKEGASELLFDALEKLVTLT
jgi:hypothetical protein